MHFMFSQLNNDQWSSLFWFICGVVICIASIHYGLGTLHNPGTGFVPFLAGLAIFIFSVIGFVQSALRQKKGFRWKSPMPKGAMWGRALLTVGGLFAYAFLLTPLGFTLCTALYLSFLLRVGKFYRWPVAIAGGIVTASATYGIFVSLLKVQFPKGPWGF
jgi:putative tricarboxylic transport membrane protein